MNLLAADILDIIDALVPFAWVFPVLVIVGIFVFVFKWAKRHKDFIGQAEAIKIGMSDDEVLNIMGCSATTAEEDGDKIIAIWEKSQWVGIQRGGTVTRAVKVTFVDGRVSAVSTKNLDKSTW